MKVKADLPPPVTPCHTLESNTFENFLNTNVEPQNKLPAISASENQFQLVQPPALRLRPTNFRSGMNDHKFKVNFIPFT